MAKAPFDHGPSWLERADQWRHRIPFWWWLTYDALVGVVIVAGTSPSEWAFWLGWAVLFIAVVIDAVEFWVKRPASRAKLAPKPVYEPHPREFEDAVLRLIHAAEGVNANVMKSGLAFRRGLLTDECLYVRSLIEDAREARRAALRASA